MLKKKNIKVIRFDNKYIYHNNKCNKKNTTYFFYNKISYIINNTHFKSHGNYQSWEYLCTRIYGFNKKMVYYILPYLGYNKRIHFTDVDEYYFIFFKYFLKYYSDYFTLNWFIVYLKQRTYTLPLLRKGLRYLKKLPSRGQRTKSNYNTSKNTRNKYKYVTFVKKLNKRYISTNFPSWKQIYSFYFHRF